MRMAPKLRQAAVYWPPATTKYNSYGVPNVGAPQEIKCRWEKTTEEFIDSEGTKREASASVMLEADVAVGGRLMLGVLDDLSSDLAPPDGRSLEILRVSDVPVIKANQTIRTALV